MGYPEHLSLMLHLDPSTRIVYVNPDPKMVPRSAVKCRASFDSVADKSEFLKALERNYTIYMTDDNNLAAEIGITTFTKQPRTGQTQSKRQ